MAGLFYVFGNDARSLTRQFFLADVLWTISGGFGKNNLERYSNIQVGSVYGWQARGR